MDCTLTHHNPSQIGLRCLEALKEGHGFPCLGRARKAFALCRSEVRSARIEMPRFVIKAVDVSATASDQEVAKARMGRPRSCELHKGDVVSNPKAKGRPNKSFGCLQRKQNWGIDKFYEQKSAQGFRTRRFATINHQRAFRVDWWISL